MAHSFNHLLAPSWNRRMVHNAYRVVKNFQHTFSSYSDIEQNKGFIEDQGATQMTAPRNELKPCRIPLTQGKYAIVDAEDYEWLNQWKWYASYEPDRNLFVAKTRINTRAVRMHRMILNAPNGVLVDHKNYKPLDNRRVNLRLCSNAENAVNCKKKKRSNKASRYRGVCWARNNWCAEISFERKKFYLGRYETQIAAAHAYNKAAKRLHGEFACLNKI